MSLTPISWLESARRYFSWTRRTWCLESSNETFLGSGGRNESNTHQFTRINLKKFSHEFDVHDVYKVGIKRFWAQEAEMDKTANSSPNRREENFSWTRRTSCLEIRNQTYLGQEAEMSLRPINWLESARRYFSWTRRTWCLESSNETFLGSGGRNESNTHQFARIGLKKISHEFDVHDVYKVGIKRFWAQEAEMGKTANSSPESSRKKIFHELDVHHV